MRAMCFTEGGDISHLSIQELERPSIGEDELLVRVHATAMNPSDYQTLEYLGKVEQPVILGLDITGEVVECGSAVTDFQAGDRVVYLRQVLNPYGGYGEYSVTPAKFACRVPDALTDEQAAVLPGAGMTAYHIMHQRFHLQSGKTILIQGGAGGVGSYAIQMAKQAGLRVLTSCLGRDAAYVHELGADVAIDFTQEDVCARVLEETDGAGVDYILSMVGSAIATKDLGLLRFGGELAVTAGLPDFSGWKFYERGLTVHEIAFGIYLTSPDERDNRVPARILEALSGMMERGEVRAPKTEVIAMEQIPEYLRKIKAGQITGKVVVRIG